MPDWLRVVAVTFLAISLASSIAIAFQYFTIEPMRDLPWKNALKQALKADTLSLTACRSGCTGGWRS